LAPARPRFDGSRGAALLLGVLGVALAVALVSTLASTSASSPAPPNTGSPAGVGPSPVGPVAPKTTATSIVPLEPVPTEVEAGGTTVFAWEALDAQGVRVPSFAVPGELSVTESGNGSTAPAWVNASAYGPLVRASNGTFPVPAVAWSGGVLKLSVVLGVAGAVTVRLNGSRLPTLPGPAALTVLPDADHLVLYRSWDVRDDLQMSNRSYSAFWFVHDRFGDPTPGAALFVEFSTGSSENASVVPVLWTTGGATGAWVNYSAGGAAGGTLSVVDAAGAVVLGPMTVPAAQAAPPASSSSLAPLALLGVALLAVGGVGGIGALLYGGRPRPAPAPTGEEEELRRLAEGRATVVDLLRRAGPLPLGEIEARWEPPPAPPALADWVASLVTDGTLTATLEGGGPARFALAERPAEKPQVTLDEEALERGLARRDAAVAREDEGEGAGKPAP
jgi:hypothetical protein